MKIKLLLQGDFRAALVWFLLLTEDAFGGSALYFDLLSVNS